jgi:hypothetical protein
LISGALVIVSSVLWAGEDKCNPVMAIMLEEEMTST